MELAKPQLDVGTMVNNWEASEIFWRDTVGVTYEKFEKIGGGVRQHRFGANGTVVKVNHSRSDLAIDPTIHRRLRIASDRVDEPTILHDPEGVEVELVPQSFDDVTGIEVINATSTSSEVSRFWVDGIGAEEVGFNRFLIGDSLVRCVHIPETIPSTVRRAAGFRYLTVQVMDVDREYARLVELGFTGEQPPVSLGTTARISFVRDPDGGYLEVSQRAEFTGQPIPDST